MDNLDSIGAGSATFLIKDQSIAGNPNAEIYAWLEQEGFSKWKYGRGNFDGIDWIYVNVNSKLYANGMPGIAITSPIGNRVLSLEDFMTIYSILKESKKIGT